MTARRHVILAALAVAAAAVVSTSLAAPTESHSDAQAASPADCGVHTRDGLNLYMAFERPGGLGGLDIWVSQRPSRKVAFERPVNLGAPLNSRADDFCPTPMARGWLFFISTRAADCNGPAVYVTRTGARGWQQPIRLGCRRWGPL